MSRRGPRGGRGTLVIEDPYNGTVFEADTLTCNHCNCVVILREGNVVKQLGMAGRTRPRNWCRQCNAYLCDKPGCADPGTCQNTLLMVDLALRYPGLPTLARGYNGELLFDPAYLTAGKLYGGVALL